MTREKPIIVEGSVNMKFVIEPGDFGRHLIEHVRALLGVEYDAGLDWHTDHFGNTYIGGRDWLVSTDPNVSILIDAANILIFGERLDVDD